MDTLTLPVSEVFGPVWQGEGPSAGRLASFVRLGHCNLTCAWCDTPYTWDASRFPLVFDDLTPEAITAQLGTDLVILSGGEPMMHQTRAAFTDLLGSAHEWHVETNGTIAPSPDVAEAVTHFTVSPKINTDDPRAKRIKPRALRAFADLADDGKAIFKFVAVTPDDVDTAAQLVADMAVPSRAVWIMPEGVTPLSLLARAVDIADRVAAHGFNLTLRQQVLMYGTERAR